ncbi:MAG: arginine--tRNA ligase [Gemmatimonadetes bacterium]|nr:arginine--tRNA ligase [Gemmatimonadota bacterium]
MTNPFTEEILERTAQATGLEPEALRGLLSVPPSEEMGDYAIPCFTLAKQLRRNPAQIAGEVASRLSGAASDRIEGVEAAGGYVNFKLNRTAFIRHTLGDIDAMGDRYGSGAQGKGKTLAIDFGAPNLAKPFGIQHLRSTAIGNAIRRIHAFLGWKCVGINYYGDYGANFGQLLAAYTLWADPDKVRTNPVAELSNLYVRFNDEVKSRPELAEESRARLVRLAADDEEMVSLWRYFVEEGRLEAERMYRILEVEFDDYLGESHFADRLDETIAFFSEKGLAEESEGALIVRVGEDIPPCMLRTSAGTSTYHSRDLAALRYRWERYRFDKMVYVTDIRQQLHFRQVFGSLERAGAEWTSRCVHAPFGLLSFGGEAMGTRKGNALLLEDVLERAVELAREIISEKNPKLAAREEVARQVGIGAVVFADVSNRRTRDVSFSLEEVLNFDGETGPYLQYTHARFCSILRRFGGPPDGGDAARLGEAAEMRVARQLAEFPVQVAQAADENEPSFITGYLLDLAAVANKMYNELQVLVPGDPGLAEARVGLVDAVRGVLRTGLELVGMKAPEEM